METRLSVNGCSPAGRQDNNCQISSCLESERGYFQRNYGSDHLSQLHDDHAVKGLIKFTLPSKRDQVIKLHDSNDQLQCENYPGMRPGRSAYALSLLRENQNLYKRPGFRSLRWNKHYREAVQSVADDVIRLLRNKILKPMSLEDVAASGPIQRNLDKNAGYFAFETGKRSKGENLKLAIEWCRANAASILARGNYDRPLVISHRSSNSKPTGKGKWKWRCRIILMQDICAMLLDGRFAVPMITLFTDIEWGEGGMTHDEVENWVNTTREHYDAFYSSDYSKFDTSQPGWLIEDVFLKVLRPLFGVLSDEDDRWFHVMVESYIKKVIHGIGEEIYTENCQVSGSLMTYMINTIVNEIIDRTALLMQGCSLSAFKSLKCGDDNLTYYKKSQPWDREKHCELIAKYFGIKTTMGEGDCGDARWDDPVFLSRKWTRAGAERDMREVVWNLTYPERYRNYNPEVTHMSVERAVALLLLCACLEQEKTAREWLDVRAIINAADLRGPLKPETVYQALANLGGGFKRKEWILGQRALIKERRNMMLT